MSITKNTLLASTALAVGLSISVASKTFAADLAPVAVPDPIPQRTISGTFDLFLGHRWLSGNEAFEGGTTDESNDSQYWLAGGDARVDIPFNEEWGLQLDLAGEWTGVEGAATSGTGAESHSENYLGTVNTTGHLNYRQMDRYLLGGFVGVGAAFEADEDSTDEGARFWNAGIEGQGYFNNGTLYGQLGYVDSDEISGDDTQEYIQDGWFVRGVGRYYVNQGRTKLEGELMYMGGHLDNSSTGAGDKDVRFWGVGLEVEHQFRNWGSDGGFNGFVRWDYHDVTVDSSSSDDKLDSHTLMVGVSFDLNANDLLYRERYGVAVDTPDWGRTLGDIHTAPD